MKKWNITKIAVIFFVITAIFLTACTSSDTTDTSNTTFTKQGEPGTPLLEGEITGITDDDFVTVNVYTASGERTTYVNMKGNGAWEAVVTGEDGDMFDIIGEVDGYLSHPEQYKVVIQGDAAFLVTDEGQKGLADQLDFSFQPI